MANKLSAAPPEAAAETEAPPAAGSNSRVIEDQLRDLLAGAGPAEFQMVADILVDLASPDDPARKKKRDIMARQFGIIYETGGEIQGTKIAVRTKLLSEDHFEKAKALGVAAKGAAEEEDRIRMAFGTPLRKANDALKERYDERSAPLLRICKVLKEKMGVYLEGEREKKRQAEQIAAAEEAAARKAAEAAAAAAAAAPDDTAAMAEAEKLKAKAETAEARAVRLKKEADAGGNKKSATGGGAHLKTDYDIEVVNFTLVGREFLVVDKERALREMRPAADGTPGRIVPGLKLIVKESAVIRS